MLSANQCRDLQTIEALRSDPALDEARRAISLLSSLTNIHGTHVYYTFNKLLHLIDGNPASIVDDTEDDFPANGRRP